jgi:hypothetical protein
MVGTEFLGQFINLFSTIAFWQFLFQQQAELEMGRVLVV